MPEFYGLRPNLCQRGAYALSVEPRQGLWRWFRYTLLSSILSSMYGSIVSTMGNLATKKCVPCEGGVPPLQEKQIQGYLGELKGDWKVLEEKKIQRQFKFKDFKAALAFINKVGEIAEKENHHPDIRLFGYNKVEIELSTHAIGGLSENDFILAAKIEQVQ